MSGAEEESEGRLTGGGDEGEGRVGVGAHCASVGRGLREVGAEMSLGGGRGEDAMEERARDGLAGCAKDEAR